MSAIARMIERCRLWALQFEADGAWLNDVADELSRHAPEPVTNAYKFAPPAPSGVDAAALRVAMLRAWCNTPDGYPDPPMVNDPATMEAWGRVAAAALAALHPKGSSDE